MMLLRGRNQRLALRCVIVDVHPSRYKSMDFLSEVSAKDVAERDASRSGIELSEDCCVNGARYMIAIGRRPVCC